MERRRKENEMWSIIVRPGLEFASPLRHFRLKGMRIMIGTFESIYLSKGKDLGNKCDRNKKE